MGDMHFSPEDVQASLCYFSALIIAQSIQALQQEMHPIFICGGGSHNQVLMHYLNDLLATTQVLSTDDIGVSADFLEAMMMAYLAWLRIEQKPLDLGELMGGENHQLHGIICE